MEVSASWRRCIALSVGDKILQAPAVTTQCLTRLKGLNSKSILIINKIKAHFVFVCVRVVPVDWPNTNTHNHQHHHSVPVLKPPYRCRPALPAGRITSRRTD